MWEHRRRVALRDLLPWLPTAIGVGALIALLVIAAIRFTSTPDEVPFTAAPQPAVPFVPPPTIAPVTSTAPSPSPRATSPSPAFTSSAPRPRPSPTRPAPPPPTVTGIYRVVQSFGDGFIGEVLIRNASTRDRDWRAELRFPQADRLITSWVESAPQATLAQAGDRFVWTSGTPVPAGGEVALRFHFSRDGTADRPASCEVNGTTCTNFG